MLYVVFTIEVCFWNEKNIFLSGLFNINRPLGGAKAPQTFTV